MASDTIKSITTLDLIKLICIKSDRLNKTHWMNIFKRHKLSKSKNNAIKEFFRRDIFSQSNALASILLSFHTKSPEIIVPEIYQFVVFGGGPSIKFIFNTSNFHDRVTRNGTVTYTPDKHLFEVDMDPVLGGHESFKFSFNKEEFKTLPRKLDELWVIEISPTLESMYMNLLMYIVFMINSPQYNFVVEEYINN